MDVLKNILSQEVVHKLGWTLLHSLWQGGVVVLLLVILLRALRKSSANLQYVVACLGLVIIVLLPVVTFYIVPAPAPDIKPVPGFTAPVTEELYEVYDADIPLQRSAEYMQMFHPVSWKQRAMNLYTSALPYIVFCWLVGVFALALWHLGGWIHLQRLKRKDINQVDSPLKHKLYKLAEQLKVTRPVKLMESALVQIPTVVGWLRPVILLPASALAGLSPEQLEALLAHELAHIRRYDYLVNIFQTLVEILGFYHPAVWWISYTIRAERENCCDDLAVSVCGDKVGYARALTSMEEVRLSQSELAVAASGGSLSRRIRRLIGTGSGKNIRFGYIPVVVSILLVVALMIPTTLALTAKRDNKDSSSVSTAESDSIKAVDSYTDATDQINDAEGYPVADLDEKAAKAQILFECKIFELPADLEFLKDEQKKDEIGQNIWLGRQYADSLEALSRDNKNVKVLSAPQVMTIDGEEAIISVGAYVPCIVGYKTDENSDDEPKPITKTAFAGLELKIKGKTKEEGALKIDLNINYGQLKPNFGVHKDDREREAQVPVIDRIEYATAVTVRSDQTLVIGGLRSNEKSSTNLFLTMTPSIVLPEKDPEPANIDTNAVDSHPERMVELQAAEAGKIETGQYLAELQSRLMQDQYLKMALEDQALELQQRLSELQMKLAELETRKAELSELKKLMSALASSKEPKSGEEPRYHMVREGETLSGISEKYYGSGNKWQKILDCNREIITADGIRVGQKLVIPPLQASAKEPESERKGEKKAEESRYHTVREGDSVAVPGDVLDDESIEAEKAVIKAQIDALEAKLIELRKNYEAEIFNRQSEWWAEMRAFTADVVAAEKSIFDANSVLEKDIAALKKIEMEIKNFKQENGANIATDKFLHDKLKTMTANRDALREQIKRDKVVLVRCDKEFKDAQYRREAYMQYRPMAGTDPNEAQRVIDLAKQALERRMAELNKLSSEQTSPKEPKTEYERLAAMAAKFAELGDFAKAIEYLENAIELAKTEKYYGIGIAIEKVDGLIRINRVLPDTPASGSSFQQGDIIKAVDGVSTEGMSLNEVVDRIIGPKDTEVTLTVKSHSQGITMEEIFTRKLSLTGSPAIEEYRMRLDMYRAGKTWPQYREMMKDHKPLSEAVIRIFKLKYTNPRELAQVLSRILERRWKGIKDKSTEDIKIVPDPDHKKLIILASPADIRLIEALITELDVLAKQDTVVLKPAPDTQYKQESAAEKTITHIIKLKYADCESVEQILRQILSDEHFKIATDKRTNMLIVAGTKSAIEEVKALIAEIDVSVPEKNLEIDESQRQGGSEF
jgi:beta-lactamase regulating signal transducer with metallopeptidase domain/LysM repeat protein